MRHSETATTQEIYLAVDSRDADTARTVLDSLVDGSTSTPNDGHTLAAPSDSEQNRPASKNDKAPQMQGSSSEADGTRTRNHRIDSQPVECPNSRDERGLRDGTETIAAQTAALGSDAPHDPDLAPLIAAWPDLPEPVRAGIYAMVRAATGG